MKGYLIDPKTKAVYPVIVGDGLDGIYKHINASCFDIVHSGGLDCFVDDEGLFSETKISELFYFEDYPFPLAGTSLVLSHNPNTGDSVDAERRPEIVFIDGLAQVSKDGQRHTYAVTDKGLRYVPDSWLQVTVEAL